MGHNSFKLIKRPIAVVSHCVILKKESGLYVFKYYQVNFAYDILAKHFVSVYLCNVNSSRVQYK